MSVKFAGIPAFIWVLTSIGWIIITKMLSEPSVSLIMKIQVFLLFSLIIFLVSFVEYILIKMEEEELHEFV